MISRYVPQYIAKKLSENELTGYFQGYVLFLDIVEFSVVTARKALQGQKGAAEINMLLEETFELPIALVIQNKGIITSFAGDAFIAVFPDIEKDKFLSMVTEINSICNDARKPSNSLKARLKVGYGDIKWNIITNDIKNEFYFSGYAVKECCSLPHNENFLLFTRKAVEKLGTRSFVPIGKGYILVSTFEEYQPRQIEVNLPEMEEDRAFVQEIYSALELKNEIRETACSFVSLDKTGDYSINEIYDYILEGCDKYHLYFNKLDYSDKGLLAIIIAGAPLKKEKGLLRLITFINNLIGRYKTLKAGLCRGKSYAGFSGSKELYEYTVLGFTPNLSVRLMQRAQPGEILVDRFTQELLINRFNFNYHGKIRISGIMESLPIYKFNGENTLILPRKTENFVGRDREINDVMTAYKNLNLEESNVNIYIHGNAGIGKTALIEKVRELIDPSEVIWCQLFCDDIFGKAFSPLIRYIQSLFMISPQLSASKKRKRMSLIWDEIMAGDTSLDDMKPFIAEIVGVYFTDSLANKIPSSSKPAYISKALLKLFYHLSRIKILVINIDDAQWIDNKTLDFLKELAQKSTKPIFFISSCRYKSDGSQVDLQFENTRKIDFNLQRLSVRNALQMAEKILDLPYIPHNTEQFIISKSQCIPLFVEQISWFIKEKGLIDIDGFLNADVEYINTFEIVDVIGSRIDSLTDKMKKMVDYAAILGMEFNISILSAMMKNRVGDQLSIGEDQNLWNKLNKYEYIFTHILLRDTIYGRMLENKQKKLHKLAALCYENLYKDKEQENYYNTIAYHYDKAEEFEKAAEYYYKAGMYSRGQVHLEDATRFFKSAIKMNEMCVSPDKKKGTELLHMLGVIDCISGNQADGIDKFFRVIKMYEELNLANNLDYISTIKDIASANRELGNMKEALKYSLMELELLQTGYPDQFQKIASSNCSLATVHYLCGRYDEAHKCLIKATRILDENHAEENKYLVAYGLLAGIYHVRNDLDKALEYNLKVLNSNIQNLPGGHYEIGRNYINTGNVYNAMDLTDEAMECYTKAMRIQKNVTGNDHPRLAMIYDLIGSIYEQKNQLDLAEEYFVKAERIADRRFNGKHPELAKYQSSLGMLYLKQHKMEESYLYLKKAMDYREEAMGLENPYTAMSWRNMGKYYTHNGNIDAALPYYTKSLELFQKLYGEFHPITLEDYNAIGEIHLSKNEYKKALEKYNCTEKAFKTCFIAMNHERFIYLVGKAECLIHLGINDDIKSLINKAEEAIKEVNSPILKERLDKVKQLYQ